MNTVLQAVGLGAEGPQYLTFGVGDDDYAIGVLRVREILAYPQVTRVPEAPLWIRGVINLRGRVVPVVDLGAKFGLGDSTVRRTTCVIVVELDLDGEQTVMGVMTDRVTKVVALSDSEIEPAPPFGTPIRRDCVLGLAPMGERLACILDIDRVLSTDEILAAEALMPEAVPTAEGSEPRSGNEAAPPEPDTRRRRKKGTEGAKRGGRRETRGGRD